MLVLVALVTVNVTVALLVDPLACTEAQVVPVPDATAHVIVIPGPVRAVTLIVPVLVPAVAVTFVSTDVTSVDVA